MTPDPISVPSEVFTVMATTELATALVTLSQSGAVPAEVTIWVVAPVATLVGTALAAGWAFSPK